MACIANHTSSTYQHLYTLVVLVIIVLKAGESYKAAVDWNYLTYSQDWPVSLCIQINQSTPPDHICNVPGHIKGWVIHGLWPSSSTSDDPINCNETWTFNDTDIKGIKGDLNQYWPNLFSDRTEDSLWIHEWEKHGTCATSLPALDSELKYFSIGLELHSRFNLSNILLKGGIVPSTDKQYTLKEIQDTLVKGVGNDTLIECFPDEKNSNNTSSFISEIHVCMDLEFKVVNCSAIRKKPNNFLMSTFSCPEKKPLKFFPLDYKP